MEGKFKAPEDFHPGWSEIHVLVGNDPDCHWKVSPDEHNLVQIIYYEKDDNGDFTQPKNASIQWPVELTPRMVQAVELVTEYINQNPL